jgi:hypothetical protein
VSITIGAENLKEAKEFAVDYFPELVQVDANELNDVMVNSIKPIKRTKVAEIDVEVMEGGN